MVVSTTSQNTTFVLPPKPDSESPPPRYLPLSFAFTRNLFDSYRRKGFEKIHGLLQQPRSSSAGIQIKILSLRPNYQEWLEEVKALPETPDSIKTCAMLSYNLVCL
jgi:hypothetical protein